MLLLVYKLFRPVLPISSGLAAWIVSRACGAGVEESSAAALSIGLSTIGASFYHYGGANWMYARKSDRLKFKDPEAIRLIGLGIFCASVAVAVIFLPKQCVLICLFNTLAIAAYSAKLSSHWLTKNLTMGIVSTTPVVIGWQAGSETHAIVLLAICLAALSNLAREIVKDVKDILANEGKRITLPMVLGKEEALQCAGILLIIVTVLPLLALQFTESPVQMALVICSAVIFFLTALVLLLVKRAGRAETLIHTSICLVLVALAI